MNQMNKALGRTPQEGRVLAKEKRKAKEKREEYAITHLRETINPNTTIFTRTEFGSGERDYVRVYIVTDDKMILDMSYFVAIATKRKMTLRGISVSGVQFSKALEVAQDCWQATFGQTIPFDQLKNWREIH